MEAVFADHASLESTPYAQALIKGKRNYRPKEEYPEPQLMRLQHRTIQGKWGLDPKYMGNYYGKAHYDLMRHIVPLRDIYVQHRTDAKGRQQINTRMLEHWLVYMDRKKELCAETPHEFWMTDRQRALLKDVFDRFRNRENAQVQGLDLIDYHGALAKGFTFDVPINPRNLCQLTHPHMGYMAFMPNRSYSWDEMLQMYEFHMVASREKHFGRTLHAEEIAALSFWLLQDTEKKGMLDLDAFNRLLVGFRFDPEAPIESINKYRGEFAHSLPEREPRGRNIDPYVRWDVVRQIFLDRGL